MKVKVLLLSNVAKLWNKWDIVEVSDAYARNVLIKQWKWKIADKATIKAWERKQKKEKEEKEALKNKLEFAINDIKKNWLELFANTSDDWHLYEKIDVRSIEDMFVKKYGFRPKNKEIDFPEKKVSKIGEYTFFYVLDWKKISLDLKIRKK